jgi:hypothetical protein
LTGDGNSQILFSHFHLKKGKKDGRDEIWDTKLEYEEPELSLHAFGTNPNECRSR